MLHTWHRNCAALRGNVGRCALWSLNCSVPILCSPDSTLCLLQSKELNNGRLAMIAIAAFVTQVSQGLLTVLRLQSFLCSSQG